MMEHWVKTEPQACQENLVHRDRRAKQGLQGKGEPRESADVPAHLEEALVLAPKDQKGS